MRRVFAWSIPLLLIGIGLLWPLVIRGESGEGPSRRRPGGVQQFPGRFRGQRRTAGSTPWKRSPPSFPAGAMASSGTGTTTNPNNRYRAANTRDHVGDVDGARTRRTACCGRTAGGSGWPRSVTRRVPQFRHPRVRDPLHRPRCPRPGQHRRRQEIRRIHRRRVVVAFGVLLECHRPVLEQPDPTGRHLGDASRRCLRRAVFCRLRGRLALPRPDRHRQQGRAVGELSGVPHAGDSAGRCRRPNAGTCGTAVALHLGSDPRPVVERPGVDPELTVAAALGGFSLVTHHGREVARVPAAIRAAARPGAGADRIHSHRIRSEECPHRDAFLSGRTQE